MSESELLRKALLQRGACRLCLAPDTECVPIFSTSAADKEPLPVKILACVAIKVSAKAIDDDRRANVHCCRLLAALCVSCRVASGALASSTSVHIPLVENSQTKQLSKYSRLKRVVFPLAREGSGKSQRIHCRGSPRRRVATALGCFCLGWHAECHVTRRGASAAAAAAAVAVAAESERGHRRVNDRYSGRWLERAG